MRKLSATILDFGSPLLDSISPDAPLATQRQALMAVILVWNATIVDEAEGTAHLDEARTSLNAVPGTGREQFTELFDELAARKKRPEFSEDKRLVGNWELRVGPRGEASLWAEARALGTASNASAPPARPMIKPRFR